MTPQTLMPLALEDLSMFGRDPWWLVVIKAVFCFAFLMVTVLVSIVWERKVVAWMMQAYAEGWELLEAVQSVT
ncbi:hypothetical protein ACWD6I_06735, partial [Streptomyces sp. NPDC002454]